MQRFKRQTGRKFICNDFSPFIVGHRNRSLLDTLYDCADKLLTANALAMRARATCPTANVVIFDDEAARRAKAIDMAHLRRFDLLFPALK